MVQLYIKLFICLWENKQYAKRIVKVTLKYTIKWKIWYTYINMWYLLSFNLLICLHNIQFNNYLINDLWNDSLKFIYIYIDNKHVHKTKFYYFLSTKYKCARRMRNAISHISMTIYCVIYVIAESLLWFRVHFTFTKKF